MSLELATDDYFVDIVFGEKKFAVAVVAEKLFNAAVGINTLHWKTLTLLHLDIVGIGQMVATVGSIFSHLLGVEQRQDPAAWKQACAEAVNHRADHCVGQVIERRPQQHHVEKPAGELEVMFEKRFRVELLNLWSVPFLHHLYPFRLHRFVDNVCHVDAVSQAGQEIDVGRRGWTDVEDAEIRLLLKVFVHGRPRAGVPGHTGPGEYGWTPWSSIFSITFPEQLAQHDIVFPTRQKV